MRLLEKRPPPESILILCTGNICRSPYAEKAFLRLVAEGSPGLYRRPAGFRVRSGGFLASDRPSPPEAVRIASERGIELSDHRSRQLDAEMLAGVDLVVAMERRHVRQLRAFPGGDRVPVLLLGDLDPMPPDRREIRDPWGHPEEVYHASFDRVERCTAALLRACTPSATTDSVRKGSAFE